MYPNAINLFSRLLLLCLGITLALSVTGQSYTAKDSVAIYKLLDQADAEDLAGKLDQALVTAQSSLQLSRQKKMQRGTGFALLKIADLQLKKNGSKGLDSLYNAAFAIGRQLKDSFLLGLSYHQYGQFFRDQAAYKEAGQSLVIAAACYAAIRNNNYAALVLNDLGFVYEKRGLYDSAAGMYLKAIRLFQQESNLKEEANTWGNLGITRYRMGLKEEAISMFKTSAALREKAGDIKGLAAIYGNLVTAYTSLNKLDTAFQYQKMALAAAEKTGVKNTLAQAHSNTSVLLARQKLYKDALYYEQQAVDLYGEMGDAIRQANRYIVMAGYYDLLRDSAMATAYFSKAAAIAEQKQNKPLQQTLFQAQSVFFTNHQNPQPALDYYRKYVTVKDSLMNEKVLANINELKEEYEVEKKDNEIARLKSEQQIRQLESEKQRAVLAGNRLEAKRKEDQIRILKQEDQLRSLELKHKQQELQKQEMLARENEQQLLQSVQSLQLAENEKALKQKQLEREKLLRNGIVFLGLALMLIAALLFNRFKLRKKIQEQEHLMQIRNKISADLHDDIGSTLTSINVMSMVSEQSIQQNPLEARAMLREIAGQSKSIQQSIRDIVWAIRPDQDKVENFIARMREYVGQTLENGQVETVFNEDPAASAVVLPMEYRKEMLMIFKEAVSNIVKHAGAGKVTISIRLKETSRLELIIADNGSWKTGVYQTGSGTKTMKQRAESLGGHYLLEGTANGTTVTVSVPIPIP